MKTITFHEMKNYLRLYKILSGARGNIVVTLPDGRVYRGATQSEELCRLLMDAEINDTTEWKIGFEEDIDAALGMKYLMEWDKPF